MAGSTPASVTTDGGLWADARRRLRDNRAAVASAMVVVLLLVPAVTARLEVDFRRPVPVGSVLHIDARIVGQSGRKVYTRAEGRLGADGPIALTASALFLQVPLEHFVEHGRPEDVQAAAAERTAPGNGLEVNP